MDNGYSFVWKYDTDQDMKMENSWTVHNEDLQITLKQLIQLHASVHQKILSASLAYHSVHSNYYLEEIS